jgi:dTDP-4-amino-4,6-dideoxygalactose transaminase
MIRTIRQRSNFGFDKNRSALTAGFNAKFSEYHAAIALAALDTWSETRAAWMSVAGPYRRALAKSNCIDLQAGFGETWVSSTCIVTVDERVSAESQQALAAAGIETRLWWGKGAHRQPAMAAFPRAGLPVTEDLARSTFGLPIYPDLKFDQMQHVVTTLIAAASSA